MLPHLFSSSFRPPLGCGRAELHSVPSQVDAERLVHVSQPQQGYPELSSSGTELPGRLSRLGEDLRALGNAGAGKGRWEAHGQQALADHAHVVGPGCQLLPDVAAFGEADAVHEGQVGFQREGDSRGEIFHTFGNS